MLSDTDRLTETVEQVLRAGRAGDKKAGQEKAEVDFGQLVRDCMDATRARHHLQPEAIRYEETASRQTSTDGYRATGTDCGCGAARKICAPRFPTCSTML